MHRKNRTFIKVFQRDKDKLMEMLYLRRNGWSAPRLAKRYGLQDHTSILHWCKKYGVKPKLDSELNPFERVYTRKEIQTEIRLNVKQKEIPKNPYIGFEGKINQGRMYKDYLEDKKFNQLLKKGRIKV